MKAIDLLVAEHDLILRGVSILGHMARRAHVGQPVPASDARAMLEFIQEFADARHHAKEERVLFPALEAAGIPRAGGPLGCMLAEHEQGRDAVRTMAEAVTRFDSDATDSWVARGALGEFAKAALVYAHLLSNHIAKENQVLFRMANSVLDPSADDALVAAYRQQELAHGAAGTTSFVAILDGLEETYGAVQRVVPGAAPAPVRTL